MNKFTKSFFFAITIFLLSGCIPLIYTTIDVDIYEPPEYNAEKKYQTVGIVYNNIMELPNSRALRFMESSPDSLHTEQFMHNPVADYHFCFVHDYLANSEYFDKIIVLPYRRDSISATDLVGYISLAEIEQYKSDYPEMDLLLALNFYHTRSDKDYLAAYNLSKMNLYTSTIWQIVDLSFDYPAYFRMKTDTLTWEAAAYSRKEANSLMPDNETAMLEGAEESAIAFGKYLTPHWEMVSRLLYISGNYELKNAHQLAMDNKWDEAVELWKKHVDNGNSVIAAKVTYNLAVASEVAGNIPAAMEWLGKSIQKKINDYQAAFEHKMNIFEYTNILEQRYEHQEKLDKMILPDDF